MNWLSTLRDYWLCWIGHHCFVETGKTRKCARPACQQYEEIRDVYHTDLDGADFSVPEWHIVKYNGWQRYQV